MCLIVKKPSGSVIPDNHLLASYSHNSDGWGVMYAQDGRVRTMKGMGHIRDAMPLIDGLTDTTVYLHMRYATHGTVNTDNAHPFCILDHAAHGRDLYLMHNGVLHGVPDIASARSDTYHYAMMLRGMFSDKPALLDDQEFFQEMANDIRGSKFVFLFGDGREIIVNRKDGTDLEGLWYSNTYSLEEAQDWRNYGTTYAKVAANATCCAPGWKAPDEDESPPFDIQEFRDKRDADDAAKATPEAFDMQPDDIGFCIRSGGDAMQILGELTDDDITDLAITDPDSCAMLLREARDSFWG